MASGRFTLTIDDDSLSSDDARSEFSAARLRLLDVFGEHGCVFDLINLPCSDYEHLYQL